MEEIAIFVDKSDWSSLSKALVVKQDHAGIRSAQYSEITADCPPQAVRGFIYDEPMPYEKSIDVTQFVPEPSAFLKTFPASSLSLVQYVEVGETKVHLGKRSIVCTAINLQLNSTCVRP